MLEVARKLTKLLESEPDPREGAGGRREFNQTKLLMSCPPTVGGGGDGQPRPRLPRTDKDKL